MIKIENLNKFFNKGKKNELHIINNINLTLDDTGLVALLGPSGSGKTTLLNAIGGLDKVKSGNIYINNQKITSQNISKVDKVRNLNIGYIFQDYKLIDNLSVYDNVALVLKMLGIKDKNEIKTRVDYVLDKVGMYRYRNRPTSMLSGGERQRVGIARAIVKDPNIIIADEPTGNLDNKNSLEIMNIIKSISQNRLVILVTHETNLAHFYASRIIEIKDGTIQNDYPNTNSDRLDYQIDNHIYLKDFKIHEQIKKSNNSIDIYQSENSFINLNIVVKNNNIYIKSNNNQHIQIIDENSNIELIDDHYKKITKEDINKYNFNFQQIINKDTKKKYSSILNPLTMILNGFQKIFNFSIIKKILLIGFLLSGMFVMYSLSAITATLTIEDKDFVTINKNYLYITLPEITVKDYLDYQQVRGVNYLLPGNSQVSFTINYDKLYQFSQISDELKGSLSSINMITEKDLIYGKLPTTDQEIVVDKLAITNMFSSDIAKMTGISQVSELIGQKVSLPNLEDFLIVGITDLQSPSIYVNENKFINILANSPSEEYYQNTDITEPTSYQDYQLYINKVELKEGKWPTNDYEVIVNINNKYIIPLNKEINQKINNKNLLVVGYYSSKEPLDTFLVNNSTIKYNLIENKSNLVVYTQDKDTVLQEFRTKGLYIKDSYTESKQTYLKEQKEYILANIITSAVILSISLIEIFFMMRSSFLSRIKEIGIYRAIGVKKIDIYKMFTGEIIAITTIASIPGLIIMAYFLKVLTPIKYLSDLYIINLPLIILATIFIYIFNLIVGLLPVYNTIKKRPAEILSRNDLE